MSRRPLALVALLVLSLGACAEESPDGGGGSAGDPTVDPELVTLGATLWQARGHQLVALELVSAGDQAAAVHATHPIEEVLASVQGEVEEHGGDTAVLRTSFEGFQDAVATGGDAESAAADALAAIEEAEAAFGDPEDSAYRGSVIAALLATAGHEYEESVQDDQISETVEYQDAFGFVRAARELYEDIASEVESASAEEAEEIEGAFGQLEAALAEPQPPATATPVEEVEQAAALIGHELEETVGSQPAVSADPEEVFARIDTLLTQVLAEYEEGETEEASELAAEVYLENYEIVEADVIRLAPDVNAELEPLLAAELRAAMQDGLPAAELEALIERASQLLDQAESAVLEG